MGYCMDQTESKFKIKAENRVKAFNACREKLVGKQKENGAGGGSVSMGNWTPHYSWTDNSALENAKTLKEFMDEWRWEITLNDEVKVESDVPIAIPSDVTDIQFTGEKIGDDETLFNAIAPFVEKGSYIQMSGEDGESWRWVFNGKTCESLAPKISWE